MASGGAPHLRSRLRGQQQFLASIHASTAVILVAAAVLGWCYRRHPQPFVALAVAAIVQWLAFRAVAALPGSQAATAAVGATSPVIIGLAGFTLGAAAAWSGWRAGSDRTRRTRGVLASAAAAPE